MANPNLELEQVAIRDDWSQDRIDAVKQHIANKEKEHFNEAPTHEDRNEELKTFAINTALARHAVSEMAVHADDFDQDRLDMINQQLANKK